MRIIFLTTIPYPIGLASSNRLRSIANGLSMHNNKIEISCILPTHYYNDIAIKKIDGIKINYLSNKSIWPKSKPKKILIFFKSIFNTVVFFVKSNKKHQIDVLYLMSNRFEIILLSYFISKLIKAKLVQEKSEYPFVLNRKTIGGKIFSFIYLNVSYKLPDGMILMTRNLITYFRRYVKKNTNLLHAPMTVETKRFDNDKLRKNTQEEYVAYCGNMEDSKDGIINLLEAFTVFKQEFPNTKLYLIGEPPVKEKDKLYSVIRNNDLDQNVIITGYIKRERLPEFLINAKLLLLARPSSLQAEGGFPTKLGEYLATGVPVVVTDVGEINNYLQDQKNAFISRPDDYLEFANNMIYAYKNYDFALEVAQNGKNTALEYFDHLKVSEEINNFLINL